VEEESWKETMVALEQECRRRGVENPWRKKLSKLQKDLSDHRRNRGLGRGKRGRPKKAKPK
jgi:hypothetical protein